MNVKTQVECTILFLFLTAIPALTPDTDLACEFVVVTHFSLTKIRFAGFARFAKQLASEVYQNKAHFKSQICYDKDLLAIISHNIVNP